jgi:hypothetical protein
MATFISTAFFAGGRSSKVPVFLFQNSYIPKFRVSSAATFSVFCTGIDSGSAVGFATAFRYILKAMKDRKIVIWMILRSVAKQVDFNPRSLVEPASVANPAPRQPIRAQPTSGKGSFGKAQWLDF